MTVTQENRRPNFFLLLNLDPYKTWNAEEIKQALLAKKRIWSKEARLGGKKASYAEKNLELCDEITRVMVDEGEQAREAQAAIALIDAEKLERRNEFEQRLAFFNAREIASQKEIDDFIDEYKDVYSSQEILPRITVRSTSSFQAPRPRLEATTMDNITDHLKAIHMSTLYELLECPETTSTGILRERAEDLYRAVIKVQMHAENGHKVELSGHAQSIFASEEMRERYDESLRQARLQTLFKPLRDYFKSATEKEMTSRQIALFLDNAQKSGWEREVALQHLKTYAREEKIYLNALFTGQQEARVLCGACNELNEHDAQFCIACGLPLYEICPDCAQRVPGINIACQQCGFPTGNRYLVDDNLIKIGTCLGADERQRAKDLLAETFSLWRPHKGDQRTQQLLQYQSEIQRREDEELLERERQAREKLEAEERQARELQAEKERVERERIEHKKQRESLLDRLHEYISQRRFFAARQCLLSNDASFFPDYAAQQELVNAKIRSVEALLERAFSNVIGPDERIELCRQALLMCSDYQEALVLLQNTPPAEPRNVQSSVHEKEVRLSWEPASTTNVFYSIVRKAHTPPTSIQDGTLLADKLTDLTYTDRQAEHGIPLFYAIFTCHEACSSAKGALLSQPILLTDEITFARTEVNERRVKLTWEVPTRADSVLIVRKEDKIPVSPQDGVVVWEHEAAKKIFVDSDVEYDHVYYYVFYTRYKDHEGKLNLSRGVYTRVAPEAPPTPLRLLKLQSSETHNGTECEVRISWQQPKKGQVIILKSKKHLRQYEGQTLPDTQITSLGERLDSQDEDNRVIDHLEVSGVVYYTPVVLFQQLAYIGTSYRFAFVAAVQNLRQQNLGHALRLQWTWPEDCQEAQVVYNTQGWAGPGDPDVSMQSVQRAAYDRTGYFDLRGNPGAHYYITVSSVFAQNDEYQVAKGVNISAYLSPILVVTYEIKAPTRFRQLPLLYIKARTPGSLPPVVLVWQYERLPVRKNDGQQLLSLEPVHIDAKGVAIKLPMLEELPSKAFARLFLMDDSFSEMVHIYHPHQDKLRIR